MKKEVFEGSPSWKSPLTLFDHSPPGTVTLFGVTIGFIIRKRPDVRGCRRPTIDFKAFLDTKDVSGEKSI
jgi:hypothetical protein